VLKHRKFSN